MANESIHEELRELFREGATVSRLLSRAKEELGPDARNHEIAKLVRQSFGLSPGGWNLLAGTESFGNGEEHDSKLTWVFLPEILMTRQQWDTSTEEGSARWYDGLERHSLKEFREYVEGHHGLGAEGWASLSEADRANILTIETTRLSLSEDVQILAALAEQLQRRVTELERQPAEAMAN